MTTVSTPATADPAPGEHPISGKPRREMGIIMATCLVMGNMIGCGVYLLPIALSRIGSLSILGWATASAGALTLAMIFARLSRLLPQQGGLFAYTRDGFGDYAGFNVAWHYWTMIWIGNCAILVGFLSYLEIFIPAMGAQPLLKFILATVVLWGLTFVNARGVALAGIVQTTTVILKVLPLALVVLFGVFAINPAYFEPTNLTGDSSLGAVGLATAMAMWAFTGVESASIPAKYVKNPAVNIARATLWGVSLAIVIYLATAIVITGIVPNNELQTTTAPYVLAVSKLFPEGYRAGFEGFVACGALISTLGALNGWLMLQGQMPYAAAIHGLFPRSFQRLSSTGTPTVGLYVASVLISAVMAWHCFGANTENSFEILIKFDGVILLVCYLYTICASILIRKHKRQAPSLATSDWLLTALAFVYIGWALTNLDVQTKSLSLLFFLASSLVYVAIRYSVTRETLPIPE